MRRLLQRPGELLRGFSGHPDQRKLPAISGVSGWLCGHGQAPSGGVFSVADRITGQPVCLELG